MLGKGTRSSTRFSKTAKQTRSTEHSYAFGFDRKRAHEVFDYANFESDCCGFLRFTLTFEENGGPVWLSVETTEEHRPILDEMVRQFVQSDGD